MGRAPAKIRPVHLALTIVALIAIVSVAAWLLASRTSIPPDPETGSPKRIAPYFASEHFTELPDLEKYTYILKMTRARTTEAQREELIAQVDRLSEQQIVTIRDNMVDAMKASYVAQARQYRQIENPEARLAYLDRMLDERDTLEPWGKSAHKRSEKARKLVSFSTEGVFHLLMDRTTSVERAELETYLTDAFKRYLHRELAKAGNVFK